MVMSKYYTPKIEEFHGGFGYEVQLGDRWMPTLCTKTNHPLDRFPKERETVRVKYLDQEAIESLGFELKETEPHELYSKKVDEDHTWLLIPHFFNEGCELRVWITSRGSVIKGGEFDGVVKNKSELKRILKMIGYEA
jgi:hypothetical protein